VGDSVISDGDSEICGGDGELCGGDRLLSVGGGWIGANDGRNCDVLLPSIPTVPVSDTRNDA